MCMRVGLWRVKQQELYKTRGHQIGNHSYHVVYVPGSPYRDPISMTILRLQETGRLQMLYNKWWKNAGSCASDEKSKEKKAHPLGVANVGGIFFVLAVGLALAVVVGIVEFVWHAVTGPRVKKLSLEVSFCHLN